MGWRLALRAQRRCAAAYGRTPEASHHQHQEHRHKANRTPRSPTGTYVIMRKMSDLEEQSVESWIDIGRLRSEFDELKRVLSGLGIGVSVIPPDESSPFSSRIGRYASGGSKSLFLCNHPDGKAEKAHAGIIQCLKDTDRYLPAVKLDSRRGGKSRYDARDLVRLHTLWLAAYRGEESDTALGMLHDTIDFSRSQSHRRGIHDFKDQDERMQSMNFIERGIAKPLCELVCPIGPGILAYDSSDARALEMLKGIGMEMRGYKLAAAPPYATTALYMDLEQSSTNKMGNPLLVPLGFSEVTKFYEQYEKVVTLVPVHFQEFLKMGVQLRELLLFIRPLVETDFGFGFGAEERFKEKKHEKSFSRGSQFDDYSSQPGSTRRVRGIEMIDPLNPLKGHRTLRQDHAQGAVEATANQYYKRASSSDVKMLRHHASHPLHGRSDDKEAIAFGKPTARKMSDWDSSLRRTPQGRRGPGGFSGPKFGGGL